MIKALKSTPTYAVLVSCFAVGYVLRCWRRFPNDLIPLAVVFWGGFSNLMLCNEHGPSLTLNQERFLYGLIGMAIGLIAWIVHKKGLKKIENRIPFLANLLSPESNPKNQFDRSKDGIAPDPPAKE